MSVYFALFETFERIIHWFVLRDGTYEELQPDTAGIFRSQVFPGLWLRPAELWANDLAALLQVLEQGLASPEHLALVTRLASGR